MNFGIFLQLFFYFFGWDGNVGNEGFMETIFAKSFLEVFFEKFDRSEFTFTVARASVYVSSSAAGIINSQVRPTFLIQNQG